MRAGAGRASARAPDYSLRAAQGARPEPRPGGTSDRLDTVAGDPLCTAWRCCRRELDARDGRWTPRLKEAYAERALGLIGEHVKNLPDAVISRRVLSPAELERRNPNFVRGDPYAGATDLDQSYVWRPLPSYGSHATPVEALYQCGASTYPGPGLNAASGRIVARRLLRKPGPVNRARRLFGRA